MNESEETASVHEKNCLMAKRMEELRPPDLFYVQAARSLLERGEHGQARQELDRVEQALRAHADVLEVLWGVQAQSGEWQACLQTAEAIVAKAPERPSG